MTTTKSTSKVPQLIKYTLWILYDFIILIGLPTFYGWVIYQLYLETIDVPFSESKVLVGILITFAVLGGVGFGAFLILVTQDIIKQGKWFLRLYRK